MKYRLQLGKWGIDWIDEPVSEDDTLEELVSRANQMDLYEGKYQVRILNNNGEVVCHFVMPQDPRRIDLLSAEPFAWLEEIRLSYGIPGELFERACRNWLAQL
jgi:hypothetical protein